jgi:gamma-glutamyl-gamma-aminobutyrate hydrolase PuuD
MTGICRGLQFLNVMAGGKMIHHLDNHANSYRHEMMTNKDEIISVNSLHHQMILPPHDAIILGWAHPSLSKEYIGQNDKIISLANMREYEAAIFPKIKAFAVQYHPEMMENISDGYIWYKSIVNDMLTMKWKTFVERYTYKKKKTTS